MGTEQKNAAQQEMAKWLSGSQELGRAPAQIEYVCTFDLQGLRYYIFRYKKQISGKWTLGVCGGYEGEKLEHCGHIFSEEEEYAEADVSKRAAQLVKRVQKYWAEQAHVEEENKKKPGNFTNLVLLEQADWDPVALKKELKEKWKLVDQPGGQGAGKDSPAGQSSRAEAGDKNSFILRWQGAVVTVELVPKPVAGDEVDYSARKNHTWRNAAHIAKRHRAYLSVTVMHGKLSAQEAGMLLVKTVAACCSQRGVLGIYANGTVYQTEQYRHFAGMARAGAFPVRNLIWLGRYNGKKGLCSYTFGLSQFGYDEIEVLNSTAGEQELDDFMFAITNHIIYHNIVLKHGEIIGFQAWQKLPVTRSRGVAVPGESIKIEFPAVKTTPKATAPRYAGEI